MARIIVFVDGFNLYHSLEVVPEFHKYKWLDLNKLAHCFINPNKDVISNILYFTAYATWSQTKLKKHQEYVAALSSVNVEAVLGVFRYVDKKCQICKKTYQTFEEKRTDVNIAIKLFQTAINNSWDTALIISGDSDLIPAIEAIKKIFPQKQIGIVIPIGRRAEELKQIATFHKKIKQKHLQSSQLPDSLTVLPYGTLTRPSSWV
jgi:uncharacterized LabA/DUF88 family protein